MRVIYNEGRVQGLSSYESYLRQILSVNPNANALDERKWLSAALNANQSMVLKIPAGTTRGVHDYTLPKESDLCGCSIIYATVFEGKCTVVEPDPDERYGWAIRVDDYGRLISNTYEHHPETPGLPENVPYKSDPITIDGEYLRRCKEYLKLTGALMLQPGEWITNIQDVNLLTEQSEPILTEDEQELLVPYNEFEQYASFKPDLSKPGFVRIGIDEDISYDLYIILTGFSYKTLTEGEVSYEHLDFAKRPEDGDFLGPARFPWGCKIILTLASDIVRVLMQDIEAAVDTLESLDDVTIWTGTREQWEALSPASRAMQGFVSILDE